MDKSLVAGFKTLFLEQYEAAKPVWDQIAVKVDSDSDSEVYGWLGGVPQLREMNGERMPKTLKDYDYTIRNEEWEATIEISHRDMKFNKLGDKNLIVRQLGERAALFPDKLVFDLLETNGVCYDGQNFFDTDHEEGASGVQSNILTAELDATTFAQAEAKVLTFKDDQGEFMYDSVELTLVVPPGPRAEIARALLENETVATGGTNNIRGRAKLLVHPRVASNRWFLMNTGGVVKPLIYQEAEFIPFEALENRPDANNFESFMRKKNYYGPYILANAGYGDWRRAVRSTVS